MIFNHMKCFLDHLDSFYLLGSNFSGIEDLHKILI